jgi:TPR repeat protein
MKVKCLILAVLLLGLGSLVPLPAQPGVSDRDRFAEVKARADKGNAEAQVQLAGFYTAGEGVPRDLAKAAKWHRKAAAQGNARGQCLLGLDYADGSGVKKNMADAVYWLRKAADQGLAEAQYNLGMCYAGGELRGRSIVDAAEWYRKAASQGLAEAEAVLGNCYFEGTGVPKNMPEGIRWTRKAAEQGVPSAQRALGICYAKGKGVETNHVQAYKWLALAAARDNQNSDDIKVNLSMVERFMTPEQIAEGQKLANEFVPGRSTTPPGSLSPAGSTNSGALGPAAPAATARTGLVQVKADDETHEIFVDGAFVGNAPAKLKLVEGSHVIEVKKPGFKDYRKQIQMVEGSELTIRVVLGRQ